MADPKRRWDLLMTDLNSLTLADLEALAARMETAARQIREAQALLTGGPVAAVSAPSPSALNPSESVERARLLAQMRQNAPADFKE